jgi:hypothetical protein
MAPPPQIPLLPPVDGTLQEVPASDAVKAAPLTSSNPPMPTEQGKTKLFKLFLVKVMFHLFLFEYFSGVPLTVPPSIIATTEAVVQPVVNNPVISTPAPVIPGKFQNSKSHLFAVTHSASFFHSSSRPGCCRRACCAICCHHRSY